MIDQLDERVRAFVAEELAVSVATLRPETRLNHDLGCDGDDAVELLEAFGSRFGVDLSAFAIGRHFGSEAAFNPLWYLYMRLRHPDRLRFVPVTIGDLTEAARTRTLQNPVRSAV